MIILEPLVGRKFIALMAEGRKTHRCIKEGGDKLCQQSSSELEKDYLQPTFMQDIPNAFSPGVLCILFIATYIWGSACILNYYDLAPPVYISLLFIPFISISLFIASIPLAIGRGNLWGLSSINSLYFFGIFVTLATLLHILYFNINLGLGLKNSELTLIQILFLYFIRKIMNGESFSKLILFYRSRRIALESYNIKQNRIIQPHH